MSEFAEKMMEEAERRGIWIPSGPDNDRLVTVEGVISDARYHASEQTLAVSVRLSDGTSRGAFMPKDLFTFHGRSHKETPQEEIDREMEKTAAMFREARGKKINLQLYESHLEARP